MTVVSTVLIEDVLYEAAPSLERWPEAFTRAESVAAAHIECRCTSARQPGLAAASKAQGSVNASRGARPPPAPTIYLLHGWRRRGWRRSQLGPLWPKTESMFARSGPLWPNLTQ